MNDKEVEGSKLYVDRAQTRAERQLILQRRHEQKRSQMAQLMEDKNVYVKNLAANVDEENLRSAFSVRSLLYVVANGSYMSHVQSTDIVSLLHLR